MKQLILLIAVLVTCLGVKAQEATTDYIYSSDGFEMKRGRVDNITGYSDGLYSKDGKVLVSAVSCTRDGDFYVIYGCETISTNAFQTLYNDINVRVYIPSTVNSIAPNALPTYTRFYTANGNLFTRGVVKYAGISDKCTEESNSGSLNAISEDPTALEVARYNIHGDKLSEPTNGINIVQYSDGTADKVLVK